MFFRVELFSSFFDSFTVGMLVVTEVVAVWIEVRELLVVLFSTIKESKTVVDDCRVEEISRIEFEELQAAIRQKNAKK
ncbi:MAG: hypothetical protein VX797_00505 [Actinomycetota bacterium]|nr:hypothetical protein [Acidimicrobiaceae bacterium]MCH2620561.1 hypothetical protein [Acidimicrobiales bacterium]MEC7898463.1 hypothetical protein [Actinomycetota bacterium]|tara:strand:- start:341 stop:574 length:234 start_codon:yes stop_codon:yes gene_type:complete